MKVFEIDRAVCKSRQCRFAFDGGEKFPVPPPGQSLTVRPLPTESCLTSNVCQVIVEKKIVSQGLAAETSFSAPKAREARRISARLAIFVHWRSSKSFLVHIIYIIGSCFCHRKLVFGEVSLDPPLLPLFPKQDFQLNWTSLKKEGVKPS